MTNDNDVDLEMFTADYPEFAQKLREMQQENETLRAENEAFRSGPQEKPKNDDGTEWQPPSYDDVQSQTEEAFEAHRSGQITEQELVSRVGEIGKPPKAEPAAEDPNAGKSAADVERETAEIFTAESETELMRRLADAGALDQPLTHVR